MGRILRSEAAVAASARTAAAISSEYPLVNDRLVLSVREAADALAVSDDLVYEMVARGALPCLCFGRRKVIPRRAIELVIEVAMDTFDPQLVLANLSIGAHAVSDASASGISA